jgi:hypothetical protein
MGSKPLICRSVFGQHGESNLGRKMPSKGKENGRREVGTESKAKGEREDFGGTDSHATLAPVRSRGSPSNKHGPIHRPAEVPADGNEKED